MKKIFNFLAGTCLASALLFTACGEEDPATGVVVDELFKSTATIEGVAVMNVNTSGSNVQKYVPSGTNLIFTIQNSAYGIKNATGSFVKTTTVGSNGAFEIELPAREDGTAVLASITSDPVVVVIEMGGTKKTQVFNLQGNNSQSIVKGLSYRKLLTYTGGDVLSEEAVWKAGTYRVKLTYNDGKSASPVVVPINTEVRITVAANQFIPARSNDLVFIEKIQSGGILEIKMPAKSVLDGGTVFSVSGKFLADFTVSLGPPENIERRSFSISFYKTMYGDETITGSDINLGSGVTL